MGVYTPDAYHHSATLAAENVDLSAKELESAEVLHFHALPEDEQTLLKKVLPDGYRISCDTPPDDSPWWSLAHRPEREDAYVEYQDTLYGLWLRITDMVFIDTSTGPPDEKVKECQ